jgi:glucosylceramidase
MHLHRNRPFLAVLATIALALSSTAAALASGQTDDQGGGTGGVSAIGSDARTVEVVQTSANLAQKLTRLGDLRFTSVKAGRIPVIQFDDLHQYQAIAGVGAAMTDSSAWLIYEHLSAASRRSLMRNLFGASGIALRFIRLPMGASDFTVKGRPYSYDDLPRGQADPQLRHFSIAHDRAYIIPALKEMLGISRRVQILANPWSPPPWMKGNGAPDNLHFRGGLLSAAYGPLASYFVKFLRAYAAAGVKVTAITPQNEPRAAAGYPSMGFPEQTEAQWIVNYLQPALRAAHLLTKIYGGDAAWGAYSYLDAIATSQARAALTGVAWHCYSGIPAVMSRLHSLAPSLDQIVSECAPELTSYPVSEIVIGSIRNWASAVALWNLALDPSGGPVQPPNAGCGGCRGLVMINPRTRRVSYPLAYYELGQFGRFVHPGARRVATGHFVGYYLQSKGKYGASAGLDDVGFLNPDGSRVLVAYNNSKHTIRFAVQWNGRYLIYALPAGATATFTWGRPG